MATYSYSSRYTLTYIFSYFHSFISLSLLSLFNGTGGRWVGCCWLSVGWYVLLWLIGWYLLEFSVDVEREPNNQGHLITHTILTHTIYLTVDTISYLAMNELSIAFEGAFTFVSLVSRDEKLDLEHTTWNCNRKS